MKEKILAELKKKYEGKLTVKFMESLADRLLAKVTEESQIEGAINELDNSLIKITDLQAEGDRRATEFQNKVKEMQETIEKLKQPKEPQKPTEPNTNPNWEELQRRLDAMENAQKTQLVMAKFNEKAKDKKIPLSVLEGITLKDEGDIDAAIEKAEKKFLALKQEMLNEGLVIEAPKKPTGGAKDEKILNDIKEGSKSIKV